MPEITIGVPVCSRIKVYADFLKKREYVVCALEGPASLLLICADHIRDPAVVKIATSFSGPKVVLGSESPDWPNTLAMRMPALPIDVEGKIRQLLTKGASSSGHKVLMVEDDATAALSLSAALKAEGLDVTVCGGFSELASALALRPDFIVMDLNLPGITGDQLGAMVRAQNIPMVIFSSEGKERLEAARVATGALAVFPKDARLSEIATFIRSRLSRP